MFQHFDLLEQTLEPADVVAKVFLSPSVRGARGWEHEEFAHEASLLPLQIGFHLLEEFGHPCGEVIEGALFSAPFLTLSPPVGELLGAIGPCRPYCEAHEKRTKVGGKHFSQGPVLRLRLQAMSNLLSGRLEVDSGSAATAKRRSSDRRQPGPSLAHVTAFDVGRRLSVTRYKCR